MYFFYFQSVLLENLLAEKKYYKILNSALNCTTMSTITNKKMSFDLALLSYISQEFCFCAISVYLGHCLPLNVLYEGPCQLIWFPMQGDLDPLASVRTLTLLR